MKIVLFVLQGGLFLALGLSLFSCAKLNPNTEGQIVAALQAKQAHLKVVMRQLLNAVGTPREQWVSCSKSTRKAEK